MRVKYRLLIIIALSLFSAAVLFAAYQNTSHDNASQTTAQEQDQQVSSTPKTGWEDVQVTHDKNNITMIDYKNLYGLHIGKVYQPNLIEDADWYLANHEDRGDYYLIPYNYPWYFRSEISPPWYSCEGQGKALISTVEKYEQTGDSRYLEFSKKALAGYNSTILNDDGWLLGVAVDSSNNDPKSNVRILNSQMYCMIDLYTYYEHTGDMLALELFKSGLPVLEQAVSELTGDCGTWYSTDKTVFKLHHEHPEYIGLLQKIYSVTGSPVLKTTLDKWLNDYQTCRPSS